AVLPRRSAARPPGNARYSCPRCRSDTPVIPTSGTSVAPSSPTRSVIAGSPRNRCSSMAAGAGIMWVRPSDEVVVIGVGGRSGARRDAELREEVAHVAGDGPVADEELGGDGAVRLAPGDQDENLELASGQAIRKRRRLARDGVRRRR